MQLERSIRGIVFCGEWTKLGDDWLIEFSSVASGICRNGMSKKRGPGRRPKKQTGVSKFENDSSCDIRKNVLWRRGGKLVRALVQKGALPSSLIKKAGRQGKVMFLDIPYSPPFFPVL